MTNSESGLRGSGRPRLAPVEAGGATPLRFGDDPYVWASWLYYQEGMTQSDIAQTMGISRATVIAYLNEARERGIVNISIEPGRLASLTLAQSLKSHFNLRDCFVIPNGADDQALGDRLGVAGALALLLKSAWLMVIAGLIWVLGLFFMAYISSVAGHVYRCALYLYATEGVVPEPYSQELMDMAWKVKKS